MSIVESLLLLFDVRKSLIESQQQNHPQTSQTLSQAQEEIIEIVIACLEHLSESDLFVSLITQFTKNVELKIFQATEGGQAG